MIDVIFLIITIFLMIKMFQNMYKKFKEAKKLLNEN